MNILISLCITLVSFVGVFFFFLMDIGHPPNVKHHLVVWDACLCPYYQYKTICHITHKVSLIMEAVSLFFLLYIVTYWGIEYFIAKERLEYLLNPSVLKSLYVRVDFSRIFLNWVWFREPELTTFEFIFIPIFEVLSDAWLSEPRSFPLTVTVQVWPYFWLSSDWMGLMCGLCLNIGCLANGQFQVLTFF